MSKKVTSTIDWKRVDAIPEENYDYNEAPELTKEMMKIAFFRRSIHKRSPFKFRLSKFFKKINDIKE